MANSPSAGAVAPACENVRAIPAVDKSPFASHAKLAALSGLVVVPSEGKRPRISGWARLKRPPFPRTVDAWAIKWPTADWGFNPGASNIVVVDWDDADLNRATQTFGPTPFIVATRRGFHLYYAHSGGMPSRNLRSIGLPVDIKSKRAFVVGWGSRHPETGFEYLIQCGTLADLDHLPPFDVLALVKLLRHSASAVEDVRAPGDGQNPVGQRDRALFDYLRSLGAGGQLLTLDAMTDAARQFNLARNTPPLPDGEIVSIARGVWCYVERGTCQSPKRKRPLTAPTADEFESISRLAEMREPRFDVADAHLLFCRLKAAHGRTAATGETFAIAARAMAENRVVPGWGDAKRYRKNTKALLAAGVIVKVRDVSRQSWLGTDGKWRTIGRRPAQYQFAATIKGRVP